MHHRVATCDKHLLLHELREHVAPHGDRSNPQARRRVRATGDVHVAAEVLSPLDTALPLPMRSENQGGRARVRLRGTPLRSRRRSPLSAEAGSQGTRRSALP